MKRRLNIRMSGLGGQGAVTASHIMAMAANKAGLFSVSNPFFGAEKRMAPAESYARIGPERIYDRGELVYPDVIMVFHAQVITMQKSYTAPFYSGIRENGVVIINSPDDLLNDNDREYFDNRNVSVYTFDATSMALEIGGTELSTNMAMIGALTGITQVVSMDNVDKAVQERFGKRYVASGGTATLDEAIKKKYAKKEQLLQKNMATIKKSYEEAMVWAETANLALAI